MTQVRLLAVPMASAALIAATLVTTSPTQADEPPAGFIEGCATDDGGDYGGKAVTIGSWNITSSVASKALSEKLGVNWRWERRRAGVIDMLGECGADVYTLQEASAARKPIAADNYPDTVVQYEEVLDYLNAWYEDRDLDGEFEYALTDPTRSTCGRVHGEIDDPGCYPSPKQANDPTGKYQDNPDDHRILYNVKRISEHGHGWRDTYKADGKRATAAWARLRIIDSGVNFFVVTTHVGANKTMAGKRKQINKALTMIKRRNSDRYATILTGDFNATRYQKDSAAKRPTNAVMKFVEILGQDFGYKGGGKYGSCSVPKSLRKSYRVPYTKAARVHTWFNTTTGSSRNNHCSKSSYKHIGTAIDYIFTTKNNVRPRTWETVVHPGNSKQTSYDNKYGYEGRFVTPSDHNLLVTKIKILPNRPGW